MLAASHMLLSNQNSISCLDALAPLQVLSSHECLVAYWTLQISDRFHRHKLLLFGTAWPPKITPLHCSKLSSNILLHSMPAFATASCMIVLHPRLSPLLASPPPAPPHSFVVFWSRESSRGGPSNAEHAFTSGTLHLPVPSTEHLPPNIGMNHSLASLRLCSDSTFEETPFLNSPLVHLTPLPADLLNL